MKQLINELIELGARVDDFCIAKDARIKSVSKIIGIMEMSNDMTLPYVFKCEALHPGIFKGYTIEEEEIIKAQDTIFKSSDNYHNYEINKDHKSAKKTDEGASVDDLIGRVTHAEYDISRRAYILTGEIYDEAIALKVANRLLKYVSLRINPTIVETIGNQRFVRGLNFEELSFVRAPGDPDAKVL